MLLVPIGLLCLVGSCGDSSTGNNPVEFPYDFSTRYYFLSGSLPPKYAFHWYIAINHVGYDTLSLVLGYCSEPDECPTGTVRFDASIAQLNGLYVLMLEEGIFRDHWQVDEDPPCGGSSQAMEVTADSEPYYVPQYVLDTDAVTPVYQMIWSFVPDGARDSLWAWRDRYINGQP
jgi:hypothetical protein